jgi:hypothetical protein
LPAAPPDEHCCRIKVSGARKSICFRMIRTLTQRTGAGGVIDNRCGRHLFHDIKQRGYTGSFSNLERLLASWRRPERSVEGSASPAPIISHQRGRGVVPIRDPETGHVISPVVAAALCMKPRSMLTITQARKVDALKQGSPEFALMRSLGMRFRGIFRSGDPGKLNSWIDDAVNSGFVAIERFARVLHRELTPSATPSNCRGATARRKAKPTA